MSSLTSSDSSVNLPSSPRSLALPSSSTCVSASPFPSLAPLSFPLCSSCASSSLSCSSSTSDSFSASFSLDHPAITIAAAAAVAVASAAAAATSSNAQTLLSAASSATPIDQSQQLLSQNAQLPLQEHVPQIDPQQQQQQQQQQQFPSLFQQPSQLPLYSSVPHLPIQQGLPHPPQMWQNSALNMPPSSYPFLSPNFASDTADMLNIMFSGHSSMLLPSSLPPPAPMERNVPVSLNVGGIFYSVPLPFLLTLPDSALSKVFRGRFLSYTPEGATFIDRDGTMFKYIVDFLHKRPIPLHEMLLREVKQLRREFKYFGLRLLDAWPSTPYVVGGKRAPLTSNAVEKYNFVAKSWVPAPPLLVPRYATQLVAVPQSKALYAIGGANNGIALSSVEKHDLTTQVWQEICPMISPRKRHAACVLGDFVYVAGGFGVDNKELASVEKFDIQRDLWTSLAPMPHAVAGGGLLPVGADLLFIPSSFLSPFHYSMANNVWGKVGLMIESRMGCGVCSLNGRAYAIGGYGGPEGHLRTVEVYDPHANTWEMSASMNQPRAYPGVFVLGGRIYVVGGQARAATGVMGVELNSVECFDPALNKWSYVSPLSSPRSHMGACVACEQVDLFERRLSSTDATNLILAPAPPPPPLLIPFEDELEEDPYLSDESDLDKDNEDDPELAPPLWASLLNVSASSHNTSFLRKAEEVKRRRPIPPTTAVHSSSARLLMSMGGPSTASRTDSIGSSSSSSSSSSVDSSSSDLTDNTAAMEAAVAATLLMNAKNPTQPVPVRAQLMPSLATASSWFSLSQTQHPVSETPTRSRDETVEDNDHRKVPRR